MKGLKKNLIFWASTYEKVAGAMFLGIFVYVFMMTFVGGSLSIEELKSSFLGYIWLFICIGTFVNGFSGSLSYFPQTVSLGSTRRNSFMAMQITQHIIMLQYLLLGVVAYYFLDREMLMKLVKVGFSVVGGVLVLLALANLVCICSVRFGRGVGMAVYLVSIVLCVALVVVAIVFADGEREAVLDVISGFLCKPYLLLIGVLADAVTTGIYYRLSLKQDLQF